MKITKLIIAFFSIFTSAQTNRFIYELNYKQSHKNENLEKIYMVLDINPNDVKYYDFSFLEKDSLNKLHHSQNTNWTDQIPIKRKKNSNINQNYVEVGDNIYVYETKDILNWKLKNETQKIENFNAQKATLEFGGRNWVAWFTKDIPFNEGPYKFNGLPGLILKINDDDNHFNFELIKINKLSETYDTSNILEIRYGDKPIKASEKQVIKKAKEYFNDPFNEIRQGLNTGRIKSFEYYGIKYQATDLAKLTKEEQDDIINYYNPIELDKSLYPIQ